MVSAITLITTHKYHGDHNICLVSSHLYVSTFMLHLCPSIRAYASPFLWRLTK